MAYVDIELAIPIALLAASIVGVVLVRFAAGRGERAGKERARRLIDDIGVDAGGTEEGGMRERESASTS